MSDDDMIRRGDALRAMPTGWTGAVHQSNMDFGPNVASQAVRAILSLPAAPLDALTLERAAQVVLSALNDAGDHPTAGAMRRVFSDLADAIRALAPEPAHVTAARVLLKATPNPLFDDLKPVLMGEFSMKIDVGLDEEGDVIMRKVYVDWTTVKEIIAAALRAIVEVRHD